MAALVGGVGFIHSPGFIPRCRSGYRIPSVHRSRVVVVSSSGGILCVVLDAGLRSDVDRIAAAVGLRVVHADQPSGQQVWSAASAVVLDAEAARRCVDLALARRDHVYLVSRRELDADQWRAAMTIGVRRVLTLPDGEAELVAELSDAGEPQRGRRGAVIAVLGGRGGAGASVFATAVAMVAAEALLVDVDPWGGGIDLLVGSESSAGLRWPDLALQGGRLAYAALHDALPSKRGVTVLSAGRTAHEIDARALAAVLDAATRGGVVTVCDVARRACPATEVVLEAADLVVLVTSADVRSCAATAAVGSWVTALNPNVGVVVRGPAPGGLRATDVAALTGLPLLAAMRPQPQLSNVLEHGGLTVRARSPLAVAARQVHQVLGGQSAVGAA